MLGVRALISPFAAGSLRPEIRPGDFVVCDQVVDRTWGRASTFYDEFADGPVHAPFAEPYDPGLRRVVLRRRIGRLPEVEPDAETGSPEETAPDGQPVRAN